MRTFSLFVQDDRYSVPTLAFVVAADVADVRRAARLKLAESRHHRAVEIMEDDRLILQIEHPATRTTASEAR